MFCHLTGKKSTCSKASGMYNFEIKWIEMPKDVKLNNLRKSNHRFWYNSILASQIQAFGFPKIKVNKMQIFECIQSGIFVINLYTNKHTKF